MAYNKRVHLQENINAIKLMFELRETNQTANTDERQILQKYSGFGGLKCVLNPVQTDTDIDQWSESEKLLFPLVKELYQLIEQKAPDTALYINSIKESVLTSFYTPIEVTTAISSALNEVGVDPQTILEPSAGVGAFLESVPYRSQKHAVAFEKDVVSGNILALLYPEQEININGFETISKKYTNYFDLAISNIPFGSIKIFDPQYNLGSDPIKKAAAQRIHNYFMVKSVDALREGGVMAFITTQNFLNSPDNADIRYWIEENTKILSAIRLPNNLFTENANTEVGSDLIVLQKSKQTPLSVFRHLNKPIETALGFININSCVFFENDHNVIFTDKKVGTDLYGKPTEIYTHSDGVRGIAAELKHILVQDITTQIDLPLFQTGKKQEQVVELNDPLQLSGPVTLYDLFGFTEDERSQVIQGKPKRDTYRVQRMHQLQLELFNSISDSTLEQSAPKPINKPTVPVPYKWVDELKEHYREGVVVIDKNNVLGALTGFENKPVIFNPILSKIPLDKIRSYIAIREAYNALYSYEANELIENTELRTALNKHYDEFIHQFGSIRSNADIIKLDALGRELSALERIENNQCIKADIFQQPVSFSVNHLKKVETPQEALLASLNKYGKVDLPYMSYLLDEPEVRLIIDDLGNSIFLNPQIGGFEIKEKFLSGNVIEKAKMVAGYLKSDPDNYFYQDAYNALLAVRPERIAFGELDLNLGERWIPSDVYSSFATDLFGARTEVFFNNTLDDFFVNCDSAGSNVAIRNRYAVETEKRVYNGLALLEYALINTAPTIQKTVYENGEYIKVLDFEKTQLAASKIDQIRDAFPIWLENQPDLLKTRLTDIYNDRFNCYVKAQYDGTHQSFPGLDLKGLGIDDLYKSQKDAIWMTLQNGGGIIDHEVGGGKTNVMCVGAYEMKRLKLAQKPMIIAMKANVQTIADNYKRGYPHAKVLAPSEGDFVAEKRVALFNSMKNNNWDAVILSHEQFKAIPQSLKMQQKYFQEQFDEVDANLKVITDEHGKATKAQEKGLITRKLNLGVKLSELAYKLKEQRDDIVDFDQMGFDHIFVDESHIFKNLSYTTRHTRVAGLGTQKGAQRADNLDIALRTIQQRTGRDLGATFLSGTTITNSLTELYLLYKYLRPQEMRAQGIRGFDAWAALYAKKTADYEISSTGKTILKERFRNFVKVPELAAFYNEITDFKTAEDIGIDRPKMNVVFKTIPQNEDQKEFTLRLMKFAQTGDRAAVGLPPASYKGTSDPRMLIATHLAGDMAMDMRFISDQYEEQSDSKLAHCAEEVAKYYRKYDQEKGTQFIFCNRRENTKTGWDFYDALKEKLVTQYGIPTNEIAFAQDYNTAQKKDILCEKMNSGAFRVVLGSTATLGTGINAQERAVAVHHVDIPWRPSDLEQRNGRAVRKGNIVAKNHADNKVDVVIYAVKNSLDSYKFNLLQHKQTFINQLKTGTTGSRTLDEGSIDSSGSMQFAAYMAELSGNTDLLDKVRLEKKILILESERKAFFRDKENTRFELVQRKKKQESIVAEYTQMFNDEIKFATALQRDEQGNALNPLKLNGVEDGASIEVMHAKLIELEKNKRTNSAYEPIGELYGFHIYVKSDLMQDQHTRETHFIENRFFVGSKDGETKYTYNNGRIAAVDARLSTSNFLNALSNIAGLVERYKPKVEAGQRYIDALAEIGYDEWPKKDDLNTLKQEHAKVEKRLSETIKKYDFSGGSHKEITPEEDSGKTKNPNISGVKII